ncbi:MAG: UTP--glucose-1-phosphate uridylyltransferase [Coriobacteriales bacterium]|nr:UTP--glucose-1-phosphate uridylyltransferase [Coriobacteriales bacterium]
MIAVIPAAGMGTRFLPATKALPKEMLPVLDKPVIQYVVEEALDSGASEVVIVNSRAKREIEAHFSADEALVEGLRAAGKGAYADAVERAGSLAVSYVYQDEPLGLGDAIRCAAEKTAGESFLVLLGDVLVTDSSIVRRLAEVSAEHGGASVVAVFEVSGDEISRYGVIGGEPMGDGVWKVDRLVEKPAREEAPSNLAIFGRYLLSNKVMELLQVAEPGAGGEIQLTDAIDAALASEEVYAVVIDPDIGHDTGTVAAWLETNVRLALGDPRYADSIRKALGD